MERQYLNALGDWGETIKQMESHSELIKQQQAEIRSLLDQRQYAFALMGLIADLSMVKPAKNSNTGGRPRKSDPTALLEGYRLLQEGYVQACSLVQSPSVKAVLRWTFEKEFEKANVGVWRVDSKDFQVKLRSLEKRISEAKTRIRTKFPKR